MYKLANKKMYKPVIKLHVLQNSRLFLLTGGGILIKSCSKH